MRKIISLDQRPFPLTRLLPDLQLRIFSFLYGREGNYLQDIVPLFLVNEKLTSTLFTEMQLKRQEKGSKKREPLMTAKELENILTPITPAEDQRTDHLLFNMLSGLYRHLYCSGGEIQNGDNLRSTNVSYSCYQARYAQALLYVGRWDDAVKVAKSISIPGHRARAFVDMADHLVKVGDTEGRAQLAFNLGVKVLGDCDQIYLRERTLLDIARSQCTAGLQRDALKTLNVVQEVALTFEKASDRVDTLVLAAKWQFKAGSPTEARKTLVGAATTAARQVRRAEGKAQTLSTIARTLSEFDLAQGLKNEASVGSLFSTAIGEAAELVGNPVRHARLLCSIGQDLVNAGNLSFARSVASSHALNAANEIEDPSERSRALAVIGVLHSLAKDSIGAEKTFSAAIESTKTVSDPASRIATYFRMVVSSEPAFARTICTLGSKDVMAFCEDPQIRSQHQREFARIQHAANDLKASHELLRDAADSAKMIADPCARASELLSVATELNKLEAQGDVVQTLSEAACAAQKIVFGPDRDLNGVVVCDVAQGQAKAKDFVGASATFRHAVSGATVAPHLCYIAQKQAQVGMGAERDQTFSAAIRMAVKLDSPDAKVMALRQIGGAQGISDAKANGVNTLRLASMVANSEMRARSFDREQALLNIATDQARLGNLRGALDALSSVPRQGRQWHGYYFPFLIACLDRLFHRS